MNENKVQQVWKRVRPTDAQKESMLMKISAHEIMDEERKGRFEMKKINPLWITGAVAALLVFVFSASYFFGDSKEGILYSQNGVVVKEVAEVEGENLDPSAITMLFTEDDVFSMFDTVAFLGTVEKVNNISMDFDGIVHYRAMAVIKVDKVYKGNLNPGENIQVMLPGPVDTGQVMGADFNITRAMKPGERGIFMPMIYNADEVWEENGKVLSMKELADYAIIDTERFAFMDTEEGLLFARDTFPKISNASTLEEVEQYILEKLGQ